jgi:transcriptional regulator with XRE-family HTH domain
MLLVALLATMAACELARACRVSPTTIAMLRSGLTREPSLRLALALERYGIAPRSWLTGGVSNVSQLDRAHATTDPKRRVARRMKETDHAPH